MSGTVAANLGSGVYKYMDESEGVESSDAKVKSKAWIHEAVKLAL
jgi:hypothetical protein